jgi:hypothetical protein
MLFRFRVKWQTYLRSGTTHLVVNAVSRDEAEEIARSRGGFELRPAVSQSRVKFTLIQQSDDGVLRLPGGSMRTR